MATLLELLEKVDAEEWWIKQSSLAKVSKQDVTHEQCRKYACEDISSKTAFTNQNSKSFIIEIPEGTDFHFIGRVDTSFGDNEPNEYYKTFNDRNFVSFSTINNRNISHYKGRIFFAYNILPEDIVHIFPMDSDTVTDAECEKELTLLPSLWLTLEDLDNITEDLKVYNQVTCKTKRNGKILKPFAVIAFNQIDETIKKVAEQFEIGCIIVHPDKNAINYGKDLLYDCYQLRAVSNKMEELYGIDVMRLLCMD